MSEARPPHRMDADEFLRWQTDQDRNYELVDGVPVMTPKAMTGASRRHDRITVNVLSSLHAQLRGKPCRPFTDDIAIVNPNGNVRSPDILVDCGRGEESAAKVFDPRVLVEVLSPSTMRFDRLVKIEEYKARPSVRVVLLIGSQVAEIIEWRREDDGRWVSTIRSGTEETIPLPEIDAELAMAEIYEDTGLDP